jgi:internalin A
VEADAADRQVLVRVSGPSESRRRLLAVIRANFDDIHGEMKEFKPAEYIALPDHPGEWVDYRDLEVYAKEGKPEYDKRIGGGLIPLEPARLLSIADVKKSPRTNPISGMGAADDGPVKVFIGYSHEDLRWRDALESNLDILQREGLIEVWYDQRLVPGEEWDDVIKRKLTEAEIILFLVSTPFLASKYIRDIELPIAMQRHKDKMVQVVPVIVRTCSWKRTLMKILHALPKGEKPLRDRRDRDQACCEVEDGIRMVAETLRPDRGRPS